MPFSKKDIRTIRTRETEEFYGTTCFAVFYIIWKKYQIFTPTAEKLPGNVPGENTTILLFRLLRHTPCMVIRMKQLMRPV